MGADPTTSRVTGECSTVELQPHTLLGQHIAKIGTAQAARYNR